jgi:hypothetical protein
MELTSFSPKYCEWFTPLLCLSENIIKSYLNIMNYVMMCWMSFRFMLHNKRLVELYWCCDVRNELWLDILIDMLQTPDLQRIIWQGCINPGRQVYSASKYWTVVLNVCGFSAFLSLRVFLLRAIILGPLQDFPKIFGPLSSRTLMIAALFR